MNQRTKKLEKGITLIALVITIIVLLILAGVTINALTGENGLLSKAIGAKENTQKAEAEELVKLALSASYNNSGKVDVDQLKNNLNKIEGIDPKVDKITTPKMTVTINGYEVTIEVNVDNVMKEPGLYSIDGKFTNWDVLVNDYGMDVSKDYNSTTFTTDASSPYNVLTTNNIGGFLILPPDISKIGNYSFGNCNSLIRSRCV